jgi:hypothetical protein
MLFRDIIVIHLQNYNNKRNTGQNAEFFSVQIAGKYIFHYYKEFLKRSNQSKNTTHYVADTLIPMNRFKYPDPFEDRMLRKIFGPIVEKVTGDWREFHN